MLQQGTKCVLPVLPRSFVTGVLDDVLGENIPDHFSSFAKVMVNRCNVD
jgi:hypothetical protein